MSKDYPPGLDLRQLREHLDRESPGLVSVPRPGSGSGTSSRRSASFGSPFR